MEERENQKQRSASLRNSSWKHIHLWEEVANCRKFKIHPQKKDSLKIKYITKNITFNRSKKRPCRTHSLMNGNSDILTMFGK